MKKLPYIVVILVILALFGGADYYLNHLDGKSALNSLKNLAEKTNAENNTENKGFTDAEYKLNDDVNGFKVISQIQTTQIFEKIDLSNIKNIKIYRNRLESANPVTAITTTNPEEATVGADQNKNSANKTVYIYEIHGPVGQGSLTYLNIKLQFISQINATTETLNETGEFGNNSFFFNDQNYSKISFLLTQIGDNLYAFQFNKDDSDVYDGVKAMITKLKSDSDIK